MYIPLNDQQNLERICSLIYEATLLPFIRTDSTGQILICNPTEFPINPNYHNLQDQVKVWINQHASTSVPVMSSTAFWEKIIVVPMMMETGATGWILMGPIFSGTWSDVLLSGLLDELNIPQSLRPTWKDYYRSMTVMNESQLIHAGMLIYEWLTGQPLDLIELIPASVPSATKNQKAPAQMASLQISVSRETGAYHHSPDTEKLFLKHVRSGNKKELLQAFSAAANQKVGILSKRSPLRHQKNMAISVITLATRAAMDGGMFPEEAYTLSDLHIQHIEELGDLAKVDAALKMALGDFADKVRIRMEQSLSRPVILCRHYIFDHLFEDLSLSVLAEASGITPVHLSRLFRKETSISLTEYIQQQRIEEAKHLLSLSGSSISDISARLQFHDQSYFTKIFKKYTGKTPKQYQSSQAY